MKKEIDELPLRITVPLFEESPATKHLNDIYLSGEISPGSFGLSGTNYEGEFISVNSKIKIISPPYPIKDGEGRIALIWEFYTVKY
tara:strand:- start:311 stop:568 length:258 start_codon:yes stop_codon:yes gene_type:complete